ncbi:MAG: hypothetical protein B7Z78_11655 [Rhodospirillales bacterium 20-60-12]|nr:MAG: hypothetical protein B7Z78_11655 [Rhodospirillales bacterium 20-60-12]HQT66741.1 GNAT family N-acetyltransferase [Acetobacteraceae bacterium]
MFAATRAHAALMAALHREAFAAEAAWDEESFATLLANPVNFAFIHETGGLVLAQAVLDQAEILTICTIPAARRQGIASLLLDYAITESKRRLSEVLFLEVAADNSPAQALYLAHGFKQTGKRTNYYPNGADALLYSLSIKDRLF